ncbi:MAG: selenocysteine-specific translation elongation factor [Sarcina sp.]
MMKHIIVGTAGHIDHGKTALVKALTGVDTDTLDEEKKRGITINNGYTYLDLDESIKIGIIDVPGHEKFIKNMLAGVSSIDVVLLVIACDDGIMPQTREHLEILNILNIKKGIVVLTKSDLVDQEWIDFMKEEVKEFTKNTFMKDSPIISVSSKTNEGINDLLRTIKETFETTEEKSKMDLFRLPIDRVFSVKGFGTVVTGSVLSGSINVGDTLMVYPKKTLVKVRGIQVHNIDVKRAVAGERAAVNVTYEDNDGIERGMILAQENKEEVSYIIDAKIKVLDSFEGEITNRQRVRVYHYAKEVMARIVILDREELKANDEAFVQLRLEEEISTKYSDKLVIRTYSPMYTIAGAVVIDANSKKAKRFKKEYIDSLKMKESGDLKIQIESILLEKSKDCLDSKSLVSLLNSSIEEVEEALDKLINTNRVLKIQGVYFSTKYILSLEKNFNLIFDDFYKVNSLKLGMNKEAVKSKLFDKKFKMQIFDGIIEFLEAQEVVKETSSIISPFNYEIKITKEQKLIKELLIKVYSENSFSAPKFDEIIKESKDKKDYKLVLGLLIEEGKLVYLDEGLYITGENYEFIKKAVKKFINDNGKITLADLKDILNTSRRYLVAIFEKLDKDKITRREQDYRVLA